MRKQNGWERVWGRQVEPDEEATLLLRSGGHFRVGSGIFGPPRMRAESRRHAGWTPRHDEVVPSVEAGEEWATLLALGEAAGLSRLEATVLALVVVRELTYRQTARTLGISLFRVREVVRSARARCRRLQQELPASPRVLFWEEVRGKRRCIYRRNRFPAPYENASHGACRGP